jgi:hypothetical protein
MPTTRLENGSWPHPVRLPLGGGWSGCCTAPGHENETPQQNILEGFCNLGYASGCAWSPAERSWDSVRFAVIAPSTGGNRKLAATGEAAPILRLSYVCERDHRPSDHGELEFDLSRAVWLSKQGDARIQRMAECFLESYLKSRI